MPLKSFGLGLGLAALILTAGLPAVAQDEAEDPAVATVNGEAILQSEVLEAASRLPQEYQAQIAILYPMLVERLVDMKVVVLAAAEAGLGDDDEVQRRLAQRKAEIMRDVYLERLVAEEVTPEKIEAQYDVYLEQNPPETEVKARHILLETEEDAMAVIGELDGGADFAALAKERSTGPSAADGGDLGYFNKEQMVAPFADAAFSLEPGVHSSAPVETQFGWHVILVEDRRTQEPATFEDVQVELQNDLSRATVREKVAELRAEAEVEIVGAPTESGESDNQ